MKTSTQSNIETGQDINNTWALLAAMESDTNPLWDGLASDMELRFKKIFPIVQKCNTWAREQNLFIPLTEQMIAELNADKIARDNAKSVRA